MAEITIKNLIPISIIRTWVDGMVVQCCTQTELMTDEHFMTVLY